MHITGGKVSNWSQFWQACVIYRDCRIYLASLGGKGVFWFLCPSFLQPSVKAAESTGWTLDKWAVNAAKLHLQALLFQALFDIYILNFRILVLASFKDWQLCFCLFPILWYHMLRSARG